MRIASVEDDTSQAEQICQLLDEAGFECSSFATGSAFLRALRDQAFDLVVMDWQLPDVSGYELVSWVRQHSGRLPPILFLTSRIEESDIVAGLSVGADDYLAKPIRPGEFVARVRALLRRAYPKTLHEDDLIRQGAYIVDARRRVIALDGQNVDLSPREFDLALFLFRNIGRLLARDVIEQAVWGRAMDAASRTLDTHMSRLRIKLALRPENGVRLASVYSHGYRFEATAAHE
ncbi:two-component system, OmpR family, phosphate regulon response regulator PhoB [Cupriavidus metallidurans]|jgi:two-component system, OmpR family, phosphate regulon response regulator PhoB|uniref:Response regulator, OmpR-family n=2 Tax=Cupriavidus metallidurans TaxID=119219 RepID=Q1LFP7_CUPMC|nr:MULTISPECIES: response regulator transcription factor [Cupriavidus]HBD33426.1 DNA-binding response regulator [Cupriavidus sp.]ABF11029.1 response regulator, OmpR-family [Cupriavidus metallidurans CH34]KWR85094.1 two-component system response regulator [Cupriavidus sp. SHE]KWW39495.1 Sensory transduction protein regX3 [Cupriavidus metallidurans]MDE4920712.1 response regulator transcription factor [Cupriavidus metallidurans]